MNRLYAPFFAVALAALSTVAAADGIQVPRVLQRSSMLDSAAAFWKKTKPVLVAMLPQVVTTPAKPDASTQQLRVRAAHDGQWIAFLIEWEDSTKDDRIGLDRFGDQVAVELPLANKDGVLPSPMMGHAGAPVDIWQWRAVLQRDLDDGETQITDLYPNAQIDLYPDQVLRATDARPYMGALGLDNPVSHPLRSPVLDQVAEGWGSLTVEPDGQDAEGRGTWQAGRWRVVIAHPLASGHPESDIALKAGDRSNVAFAVWNGGNQEVGSRKAWSNWIPLRLAK